MAISERVTLGDGTRTMRAVSDPLILSAAIAHRRGLAELYPQWLFRKVRSLTVPIDFSYAEGDVHELDNPRVGICCSAVCRSLTHVVLPDSMLTRMTLETCRRFE
ncbi:hypothetical protein M0R72_06725 [Candidatus Pacearchaeota archaeon]|jgi:hypothetical protein|nr:hypothetical protein [Candidatus Pacearchaeota archaeon]